MLNKLLNNTVFKNFSYLTISTAISQLLSFFTILKITSILTPNDYGVFTFLIAQGALLLTIGDLGIRNIVIRAIARNQYITNDLVVNGAVLRTGTMLLLSLLYTIYNYFLGSLVKEQLLLIFVYTLINCFSNLVEMVFIGNQKMLQPSLINLLYSIIWFSIIYFLPTNAIDVTYLFSLFTLLSIIKFSIYILFLKYYKLLIGKVEGFFKSTRKLISTSWPYFLMVLIMLPLTGLANNFLDLNSTKEEVGYFNLSQRLIGPIGLVITMSLTAIFPNLSSLWSKNEGKFYHFISVGFKYFMLSALISCFLFSLFAHEIVITIFPKNYLPAVKVCQIQIWYLFLTSVDSLIGTVLGAINKEKMILKFGIVYCCFCTPVLFFSSNYGALGLSFGYVLSFGICQLYVWNLFTRTLNIKIRYDNSLWMLAVILFVVSLSIPVDVSILYRITLSLAILGGVSYYILRTYKISLIK
ncbi:polysaccharide biosynthesis protein [Pontibacter diazotrophicus]|uniref:Polysaccharide biosynthesis protein n=1 Tax=Pontibacter diazotrophicus TaxID=1400979 RepID=A0A3D8KZR3_9BACT|nr:oligosaccharide flippase family protein [Pontibacter diazotrophicus]RDV10668.1 polysaccharide biosynthesis protein [Pontibacter diazotrophicus]